MKYIKEEITGQDKERYYFAIGKEEAELLLGLLNRAHQVTPTTDGWHPTAQRMRNMIRVMSRAIPTIKTINLTK